MKNGSLEVYQAPYAECLEMNLEDQFLQGSGESGETPEVPIIED